MFFFLLISSGILLFHFILVFWVFFFKQHIPRFIETQDRPAVTQKFIIRKLKPKDPKRKVCHLVAHPATPDAATKPLDYSGMAQA